MESVDALLSPFFQDLARAAMSKNRSNLIRDLRTLAGFYSGADKRDALDLIRRYDAHEDAFFDLQSYPDLAAQRLLAAADAVESLLYTPADVCEYRARLLAVLCP